MARAVTASSRVFGKTRFTDTSCTHASLSRRSRMPAVSTRSSVVPAGTLASSDMSLAVRGPTPVTDTRSMAKRLE